MKLIRNRYFAAAVMAVLILAAVLLGSHRSLSGLRSRAAETFYAEVAGDNLSIGNDLQDRVEYAYSLATVAARYLEGTDAQLTALREAAAALEQAPSPSAKAAANSRLTTAAAAVYDALGHYSLSETDARYRQSLYADLNARNDTIGRDGYNAVAQAFNDQLQAFPASLLAPLTGVAPLELFR